LLPAQVANANAGSWPKIDLSTVAADLFGRVMGIYGKYDARPTCGNSRLEQVAMSETTSFLSGMGTDHRGRKLQEVMQFDDHALEATHDYIQWLFPIPEKSAFNTCAPVLTAQDIEELHRSPDAVQNLQAAAERMLEFYRRNSHWLSAADHNHLRITRIIRSLKLILGQKDAEKFYRDIMQLVTSAGSPVSADALAHWRRACAPAEQGTP
jgi:opioid growth factor receptor-like protein